MRWVLLLALLVAVACSSGCRMSDAVFDVFGSHYTGGGYTRQDRKAHYDGQLETSRGQERSDSLR